MKKIRFLVISLLCIIIGCCISFAVDTNFGTIKVQHLSLTDNDGYKVTGTLFIPDSASPKTPAPAFVLAPGGDCNNELITPYANELSRRGYVVFALDYSGAGDTQINPNEAYFTNNGTMACTSAYDYLASMDFVDKDNIGAAGHSMGSLYTYRLGLQRKLSVQISNVLYDDKLPDYPMNYVLIAAEHDEGILTRIGTLDNLFTYPFLTEIFGTDEIVPEKLYGSFEDRTARILHLVNNTHNDDMIGSAFITHLVDAAMQSMEAPNPLEASDHIYGYKIFGLFAALTGLVMFIFNLAGFLLGSSSFSALKEPQKNIKNSFAAPLKSKAGLLSAAIITLVPVLTFFPGTAIGNQMTSNTFFRLGTTPNGYMTWSLLSAFILIILFIARHFLYGKKHGGSLYAYGLTLKNSKSTAAYIVKAFFFAVILFVSAYFILTLIYNHALTDLHLWALSIRPLSSSRFSTYPFYFLALLPYFTVSLLAGDIISLKSDSADGGPAFWKNIMLRTSIGLIGLLILFTVYEIILRFTEIGPFYTGYFAHFYMTLLETIIPIFGVSTSLALYINKKTNTKYAGIFIGTALIAFCMVSSNNMVL